jgi:hypothetical protein
MATPHKEGSLKSQAHSPTIRAARHLLAGILQMRQIEAPTQADMDLLFVVLNQVEVARLLLELRGGAL